MAAATLGSRDRGHVHAHVARAQRDLAHALAVLASAASPRCGQPVPDERRHRGSADGAQMVDHALRVALLGAGLGEVLGAQLRGGQAPVVVALGVLPGPRASSASLPKGTPS